MLETLVAMVTVPDTGHLTMCEPSNSTITIEDGTTAEVFFSPPEYGVKEGDTVTLTLQLSAEVAPGVSYDVTVILANGTAHSEYEQPQRVGSVGVGGCGCGWVWVSVGGCS